MRHKRTPYGTSFIQGAEVSCLNIFSITCPKIKWFSPDYYLLFGLKIAKFLRGGGGVAAAATKLNSPSPPPLVHL